MATAVRSGYSLAAALLLLPVVSGAQSRALVGLVRDSSGRGIPGAEVRARGNVVVAQSDDSGRFHVAQMPEGARGVFVRRLGFAPARVRITPSAGLTDSVLVTLAHVVQQLPELTVQEYHDSLSHAVLAGFWERRARGFGKFVTRDDIEQRGTSEFVELMRSVPGVSIQNYRGRRDIRFRGAVGSMFRDCRPQYWVDGVPLEGGSAEEFSPDNVEAVELYASPATTPPQFSTRDRTCGTVVVWTRLPG
jgi:hypothetical protein